METPKTYKFNDKNYKLSDFQSSSNEGWDEYRSALRDGEKNQDALNQAYDYMIDGINNGTITIKDGNFYTNDENILNNKQLYGEVTYYLKRQLGKSNEYISPEEKRKVALTNSAFANNFNNYMFNSNAFNTEDFINLDTPDEKTGKRATTNRVAAIGNYLNQIDLDRDFKDFDDVTRQRYAQYIDDAKKAVADGTITSNEYLALSRLFGQQGNWKNIFTTEKNLSTTDSDDNQTTGTETTAAQQTPQQVLENYMTTEIPEYTGKEESYNVDTNLKFGKGTQQIWGNMMRIISNEALIKMLLLLNNDPKLTLDKFDYIQRAAKQTGADKLRFVMPTSDQAKYLILGNLKSRNLLTDIGDGKYMYYINKSPYALIWDTKQKKLFKTAARNVEYIVRDKLNQFRSSNGNASDNWYTKYMQDNNTSQVESDKKGGVLKAQTGMKALFDYSLNFKPQAPDFMSYSPSSSWFTKYYDTNLPSGGYTGSDYNKAVFYTDDDLKNTNRYRRWYNPETKQYELQNRGDAASTDNISAGNGLYDVEGIDGSQTPDENLEAMSWNSDWIQRLITNEKLAESFARRYKDLNGSTNGAQASNWFNPDGTFNFEKFKQEIPNGNGKLFVWSDKLNGIGHDVYKGRMYGIFDPSINQVVYYNNIPEGYKVNGDAKSFNDITDLYMLEKDPSYKAKGNDGKQIGSTNNIKDLQVDNPYDKLGKADLLALSRLRMVLDNNKRNADILKRGLTPVQYDTYRENSPITGAYTTMSQYGNMAAKINSQMADMQSADGRARILAQLKGASQADELRQKGIAADVAERARTEQLSRQYENQNKERRQTIANKNIDNLAAYRKELSSIDANRNMADFTSKDTYLKQYEADYRQKQLKKKQMYDNYIKSIADAEITSFYADEMKKASNDFNNWYSQQSTVNQNDASLLKMQPEYQKYEKIMSDIKIKQNAKALQTYMAITGQNYIPDNYWIKPKNLQDKKYKTGGKLIPKNKFLK